MKPMDIGRRLRKSVTGAAANLLAITDERASTAPAPGKWSPKQIIGHLIDSASNNHGRFVRSLIADDMVFPGYEQEQWVERQAYEDEEWTSLVTLWREFNLHLAHVMEQTSEEIANRPRRKHNLDQIALTPVSRNDAVTLGWFMNDYVNHLDHHLEQLWSALGR